MSGGPRYTFVWGCTGRRPSLIVESGRFGPAAGLQLHSPTVFKSSGDGVWGLGPGPSPVTPVGYCEPGRQVVFYAGEECGGLYGGNSLAVASSSGLVAFLQCTRGAL